MSKTILGVITSLLALASVVGCSNMGSVLEARAAGEGTTKRYPIDKKTAYDTCKAVFRWEGTDAIEEHPEDGYMLTSMGMNLVSWGAVMGAWVDEVSASETDVTVITKRRMSLNLATTLTEGTFHSDYAKAVEILKAGKPLPASKP